jgi:hypothetical protein
MAGNEKQLIIGGDAGEAISRPFTFFLLSSSTKIAFSH